MNITKFIIGMGVVAVLAGCSSGKTVLPYFTDLPAEGSVEAGDYSLHIVPGDELLINVNAADPEAIEDYTVPYQHPRIRDFNTIRTNQQESIVLQRRRTNLTYQTYVVSKDGFINFPVLGQINVQGMTLTGLSDYLVEKISEKVVNPMVTVELVNFHVNVTGEVANPGVQLVNQERYSIMDAIAAAGDLTQFGERKNVLLIRESNGKREYHRLNLNSAEVLESPFYYLKQNDIIYVEPNTVKQANARNDQDRQYRLSMTSVIVSAASVIASLAIALFAK